MSGEPPSLPRRLFAADCYPRGARLNIYSKANLIGVLADALQGTEALQKILKSQFGKLFRLPVARCPNSAKVIHGLLARQLITKKKYELWSVFGGKPLKYSLREFHIVSGLFCGQIPKDSKENKEKKEEMWKQLFGEGTSELKVGEVVTLLQNPEVDDKKRLPLALIVLVDGVILCRTKELYVQSDTGNAARH